MSEPEPAPLPNVLNPGARRAGAVMTVLILLAYGGLARVLFAGETFSISGGVVGMAFLLGVPASLGFLGVAIGRWYGSNRWMYSGFRIPLITIVLGLVLSLLFRYEALICVIMAAPLLLLTSLAGAWIAHMVLPRHGTPPRLYVTLAAFLPYIAAVPEGWMRWPTETREVRDTIEIDASAEAIWREIASVRPIERGELPGSWIYGVDFPRPIAATLDREGVGGIRTATFERGVSFFEMVTEWKPAKALAFTIRADPEFIPHTAFDQHVIVGGRFFDVLDGRYEIEMLSAGRCRLHLTSRHRLTTRFNGYAGWWSGLIMSEIQSTILGVIRTRAERAAAR